MVARSCETFDRIPDVIWNGENDHTKPFPGDRGIHFEAIEVDNLISSGNLIKQKQYLTE